MVLSLSSGLLLGLSFPQVLPGWFGVLAFVAYVPLLIALTSSFHTIRRRQIVCFLYLTFFVYHGIANWWVSSWQERTDPYLFVSGIALWLFHPFFLMLPFLVLSSIHRRIGKNWALLLSPLAICGFEWLHGQTDASYPWLTTGYSLVHTPFAQIAEYVGVYGLSFAIGAVNVLVLLAITARYTSKRVRLAAATTAIVCAWMASGYALEFGVWEIHKESGLRVLLVQPNEDPWDKWSDPYAQLATHQRLTDSAAGVLGKPDLVVWSETAIPFTIRHPRNIEEWVRLRSWVDSSGFSLLTGYADLVVYPKGAAPPSARLSEADHSVAFDMFNAAMVINPHQESVPVHRKSMLTPFAERLPFADQLTFAMQWIEWGVGISAWGKGQTRSPLPVVGDWRKKDSIGVIICIESIYPEVAADLVRAGANILCVITNDAWYNGTWGPEQHFDIARMRAIEQRRSVLRCANSGITGVILPSGRDRVHPAVAPITQGCAMVSVWPTSHRTLYSRIGDVLPIASLIIALLAFASARIPAVLRNLPFRSTTSS